MDKTKINEYIKYCTDRNLIGRVIVFDTTVLFYLYEDKKSYEIFDVKTESYDRAIVASISRNGPALIKFGKDVPLTKVAEVIKNQGKYAFAVSCGNNDQAQFLLEYENSMHFLVTVGPVYVGEPVMEVV